MDKKRIILTIFLVLITVTTGLLFTYGYFTTSVREEKQELTITSGKLALIFEDNSDGINATLSLGESVTKEFKIRNTGTQDVTTNMLFSDMINTYMEESLSYKLEYKTSEDGEWGLVETVRENVPIPIIPGDRNLAKDLTIPAGETYYYKLTFTFNDLDINQNSDLNAIFTSKFKLGDVAFEPGFIPVAVMSILNDQPVKGVNEGSPNFALAATTDEGVYAMEDDYGMSYYYRGAVENNYVKFGDFYWRIIRINGDGSLRIIYDGTQGYANGINNAGRLAYTYKAFNSQYNDAKYVGWMFGGAQGDPSISRYQAQTNDTDSDIKSLVDSWYKENIEDKDLGNKVADAIFCNDRSTPGKEETGWSEDTGLGYGTNYTGYGPTVRTSLWFNDVNKVQPRFICPQKNDAFTVSDEEKGNSDLTYPVGLITIDEIVAAGSGKYGTENSSFYLYKGPWYWTLSPSHTSYGCARVLVYFTDQIYYNINVDYSFGAVAPVINLKAEYVQTMIGDGTINNPYRFSTENIN